MRLTQGTFSFLPDFTAEKIRAGDPTFDLRDAKYTIESHAAQGPEARRHGKAT